ncbi:DUF2625 family protein [Nocardia sp. NPDC052001]|uniref:DUF2625 family protein n=1 Tax=Nocardia sp. NPDC052001 TaxID=3154853 RepID=UPI0034256C6A
MTVRSIHELTDTDDPAWPIIAKKLTTGPVTVQVLPVDADRARQSLFRLQVTARSVLGTLVLNTGGLLVDHGWLRILGGGHAGLPDVATMNRISNPGDDHGALIIAVDVLGGLFAINGGALPGKPGGICFLGSDTLAWIPIGGGHTTFVNWALDGGLNRFYANVRWPGWADEVKHLPPDQGLSVYPPLWSAQGITNIAGTSRRSCDLLELAALHLDLAEQQS